jgi:hypothetical protein
VRPFIKILGQPLIRILNSAIQIADLVIVHLVQISAVEILCQSLAEGHGEQFTEVFHCRIDSRRWDRKKHKSQNLHIMRRN